MRKRTRQTKRNSSIDGEKQHNENLIALSSSDSNDDFEFQSKDSPNIVEQTPVQTRRRPRSRDGCLKEKANVSDSEVNSDILPPSQGQKRTRPARRKQQLVPKSLPQDEQQKETKSEPEEIDIMKTPPKSTKPDPIWETKAEKEERLKNEESSNESKFVESDEPPPTRHTTMPPRRNPRLKKNEPTTSTFVDWEDGPQPIAKRTGSVLGRAAETTKAGIDTTVYLDEDKLQKQAEFKEADVDAVTVSGKKIGKATYFIKRSVEHAWYGGKRTHFQLDCNTFNLLHSKMKTDATQVFVALGTEMHFDAPEFLGCISIEDGGKTFVLHESNAEGEVLAKIKYTPSINFPGMREAIAEFKAHSLKARVPSEDEEKMPGRLDFGDRKVVRSSRNMILQDDDANEVIAVRKTDDDTVAVDASPVYGDLVIFFVGISAFLCTIH